MQKESGEFDNEMKTIINSKGINAQLETNALFVILIIKSDL